MIITSFLDKIFVGNPYKFSENSFLIFFLDTIFIYIIPAIILGHHIDRIIFYMKKNKTFGKFTIVYIIIQLFLNLIILYILFKLLPLYSMELQSTLSGLFFVALFFNMQVYLIINLQELFYINNYEKLLYNSHNNLLNK